MSPVLYSLRDGKLRCNGREIRLSSIQWRILTALLAARGRWVSRSDLIYSVWMEFDENEPEWADSAIAVQIMLIRRKLAGTSLIIQSRHSKGYRAVTEVRPEPDWPEHPFNIVAQLHDGQRVVWTPESGRRSGPTPMGRVAAQ